MIWEWSGDEENLEYLKISLYYSESANAAPEHIENLWSENDGILEFQEWAESAEYPGFYYFTVSVMSMDPDTVGNSGESEMSGPFAYTPAVKLAAPTKPVWNGNTCTWKKSADDSTGLVNGYEVILLYFGTDASPLNNGVVADYGYCSGAGNSVQFRSEAFREFGSGNYKFRVQARSEDVANRSHSEYVLSENVFKYVKPEKNPCYAHRSVLGWYNHEMAAPRRSVRYW